jgi:predicted O-linked N-acetylglucosamine transferase (SPINDLY family)
LHSPENNLPVLARKPAPVQVTWLGYPGSTGLETIDYRLTDAYLDPPGMNDEFYSEQSVRLPHCFWCYDPLSTEPAVGLAPCETSGHITFGCLNNFFKVNQQIVALWAQILAAVPDSKLILLASPGRHREAVMAGLGVNADRIEFVPRQRRNEYLRTYDRIDLVLDTFPYNGHTTNFDSLWMGLPVVTLCGRPAFSRAGLSLLSNLGLQEWITETPADYVNTAVELANDRRRLTQLRGRELRSKLENSPLMDGLAFARAFEKSFRMMWRRWCSQDVTKI